MMRILTIFTVLGLAAVLAPARAEEWKVVDAVDEEGGDVALVVPEDFDDEEYDPEDFEEVDAQDLDEMMLGKKAKKKAKKAAPKKAAAKAVAKAAAKKAPKKKKFFLM